MPRGTNRWRYGASGSSTVCTGAEPGGVEGGVAVVDADGRRAVVLSIPEATGTRPPASSSLMSSCS